MQSYHRALVCLHSIAVMLSRLNLLLLFTKLLGRAEIKYEPVNEPVAVIEGYGSLATCDLVTLRPLFYTLRSLEAPCIFYALLLNRIKFQIESEDDIATSALCISRADVCELMAMKLLAGRMVPLF